MAVRTRNAGFTLIEALISTVLASLLLGSLVLAVNRGIGLFEQSAANNDVDSRAGRAIDVVTRALLAASENSIDPNLETPVGAPNIVWSSTIDYQDVDGWAGGVQFGPVVRLAFELEDGEIDNGLDDNGNGLVDEHQVVRIVDPGPNEQRFVLVNGVSEYLEGETPNGLDDNGNGIIDERGLCFDLIGDTLNIRMSIERLGPGGRLIVRTQTASIAFRN